MSSILISGGEIVNEGQRFHGYILIQNDLIAEIGKGEYLKEFHGDRIDASGRIVMPGVIDCHVHFREPGLTDKGDMATESAAAVAGGVTSVLEMPNTIPATTSIDELERKFDLAEERMHTNYSFFLGATNENISEINKLKPNETCGVKLFMGSSTGNMLVSSDYAISSLFAEFAGVIAAHCEDESVIRANTDIYRQRNGERATAQLHPLIRTAEACYRSSARAIELADKYETRLHLAHLTTARELALFDTRPIAKKRITAEACAPHLWFSDVDYPRLGNRIKCNPAIKTAQDRNELREALTTGRIDIIATDHAPHAREEKERNYWDAPSGIPMIQYSLPVMMELQSEGIFTIETLVEKMCHSPSVIFGISDRGFLREGYKADITIIDPTSSWMVSTENIVSRCGWSPLEGQRFGSRVERTIVNGKVAYDGKNHHSSHGSRLTFRR